MFINLCIFYLFDSFIYWFVIYLSICLLSASMLFILNFHTQKIFSFHFSYLFSIVIFLSILTSVLYYLLFSSFLYDFFSPFRFFTFVYTFSSFNFFIPCSPFPIVFIFCFPVSFSLLFAYFSLLFYLSLSLQYLVPSSTVNGLVIKCTELL